MNHSRMFGNVTTLPRSRASHYLHFLESFFNYKLIELGDGWWKLYIRDTHTHMRRMHSTIDASENWRKESCRIGRHMTVTCLCCCQNCIYWHLRCCKVLINEITLDFRPHHCACSQLFRRCFSLNLCHTCHSQIPRVASLDGCSQPKSIIHSFPLNTSSAADCQYQERESSRWTI